MGLRRSSPRLSELDRTADAGSLQALGVRRLSAGSAIAEAMQGHVLAMMRSFMATGRIDALGVPVATYGEVQALMARG